MARPNCMMGAIFSGGLNSESLHALVSFLLMTLNIVVMLFDVTYLNLRIAISCTF